MIDLAATRSLVPPETALATSVPSVPKRPAAVPRPLGPAPSQTFVSLEPALPSHTARSCCSPASPGHPEPPRALTTSTQPGRDEPCSEDPPVPALYSQLTRNELPAWGTRDHLGDGGGAVEAKLVGRAWMGSGLWRKGEIVVVGGAVGMWETRRVFQGARGQPAGLSKVAVVRRWAGAQQPSTGCPRTPSAPACPQRARLPWGLGRGYSSAAGGSVGFWRFRYDSPSMTRS